MASRTRPLSSREMKRRLRKAGWRFVRQCNSAHEMWESADGSFTHVTSFTSKMMDTRATAELLAKIEASQAATRAETQVEEPMESVESTESVKSTEALEAAEDKSPVRGDPHRAYWHKKKNQATGCWQISRHWKEDGKWKKAYAGTAATRDEAVLKVLVADEQWGLVAKQEAALASIVPVTEHPKYQLVEGGCGDSSCRTCTVPADVPLADIADDVLLAEIIRRLGNFSADDGDPAVATLRGSLAEYRVSLQPIVRHLATMEGTAACTGKDAHDVLLPPRLADVNCADCKRTAHYKTVQWVLG